MSELPDCSIDAIVTDPPYELGFMGKSWDASGIAYNVEVWRQCLRILKPGGYMLAFGGSRTYHRLACAVEDAGFEIRDQIMWVYGSGFPKSLNVSKSIEGLLTTGSANKTAFKNLSGEQVERGNWGISKQQFTHGQRDTNYDETAGDTRLGKLEPTTDAAKQWQGWGTALKPAHEPIVLARKPLDGTVANNVLTHGTGGINVDGCRVGDEVLPEQVAGQAQIGTFERSNMVTPERVGRWPANFIHDGSDEVLELFPNSKGGAYPARRGNAVATSFASGQETEGGFRKMGDDGSAARFFYCAKASTAERNAGLKGMPKKKADTRTDVAAGIWKDMSAPHQNHHPTVKPVTLMRYLVRLVTPPNGVVLDPFLGSGTTAVAAIHEGVRWFGFEMNSDYAEIASRRTDHAIVALCSTSVIA